MPSLLIVCQRRSLSLPPVVKPLILMVGLLLLGGCSGVPTLVNHYRIDIQQGNVISQEQVSQLRPGLKREQVRFILGSPLLTDPFHADRWDYIYRHDKRSSGVLEQRRLTVFFDANNTLTRVEGDVLPQAMEGAEIAGDAAMRTEPKIRVIELSRLPEGQEGAAVLPPVEEGGLWNSFKDKLGF